MNENDIHLAVEVAEALIVALGKAVGAARASGNHNVTLSVRSVMRAQADDDAAREELDGAIRDAEAGGRR